MQKVVRYDRHARRRMRWRKISEIEIVSVLKEPDNSLRKEVLDASKRLQPNELVNVSIENLPVFG